MAIKPKPHLNQIICILTAFIPAKLYTKSLSIGMSSVKYTQTLLTSQWPGSSLKWVVIKCSQE